MSVGEHFVGSSEHEDVILFGSTHDDQLTTPQGWAQDVKARDQDVGLTSQDKTFVGHEM